MYSLSTVFTQAVRCSRSGVNLCLGQNLKLELVIAHLLWSSNGYMIVGTLRLEEHTAVKSEVKRCLVSWDDLTDILSPSGSDKRKMSKR
jgi:hypothetical protein